MQARVVGAYATHILDTNDKLIVLGVRAAQLYVDCVRSVMTKTCLLQIKMASGVVFPNRAARLPSLRFVNSYFNIFDKFKSKYVK